MKANKTEVEKIGETWKVARIRDLEGRVFNIAVNIETGLMRIRGLFEGEEGEKLKVLKTAEVIMKPWGLKVRPPTLTLTLKPDDEKEGDKDD